MPLYRWEDKKTGKKVEVLRSFKEYDVAPTQEEAPDVEDPEWERKIGGGQKLLRGNNWTGSKGNWIVLLIMGGGLWQLFQDILL